MNWLRKLQSDEKGLTFLEVLVSVVILALIISPFLGVFVTSARYTVRAQDITNATYTGEHIIEELVGLDYAALLSAQSDSVERGGMYAMIRCEPAGVHSELLPKDAHGNPAPHCYLHILYGETGVLVVGPDGYRDTFPGASTLALGDSGLTADGELFPVSAGSLPVVVILNNAYSPGGGIVFTNTRADTRLVYYTNSARKSDLTASGVDEGNTAVYEGVDDYARSLVRVIVSVYRDEARSELLCVVEDYLRPRNWPS